MAASPPAGKGLTAAQWEAWFTANANPANPKYTGSAKAGTTALAGKTWAQVYAAVYAWGQTQTPKATPDQAAGATQALAAEEALAVAAGTAATQAGGLTADFTQALPAAASWAAGLTGFLAALTSANTWIRVSKAVVGGVLLIVGLVHITGAEGAVASAAKKVPLPV